MTTSAGQATRERALTEAALERKALQSYRRFLRESTQSRVTWAAWNEHVDRMIALFAQRFPDYDTNQLRASLLGSKLPTVAYAELLAGTKLLPRSQPAWGQENLYRWLRTESTAVSNAVSLRALASEGYPRKRWVSHHDNLVRPSHLAANGQTVSMSGTFAVGGSALMYPGDPVAPYGERENCRCVIVGVK